ncbi:MAG: sulfotransferase domain-containing protein [Rhizobiales bacterium]|nr:sulfotransferase domain-containing protein [Hyphomicrobiales bacterium]
MPLPSIFQIRTALRQAIAAASAVLPRQTSVGIERRLRCYEESKKLARADGVVVSFGKSGRTWLTVLLSRYFAQKYGLLEGRIMDFDDFHRHNRLIPVIFFTHDNYIKDYLGSDRKFDIYGRSRIVLLIRDPRDTAVSQYFQWKHRMLDRKKLINAYPAEDNGVYDFVAGDAAGIPKTLYFLNAWARDIERFPTLLVVKYEDLRAATRDQLRRVLEFFGQSPTAAELDDCVAYASLDNMRRMERENAGRWTADARLRPGDANDPASFKVRRGKVGGWRDYMTDEEAIEVDRMVREGLSPIFGYN